MITNILKTALLCSGAFILGAAHAAEPTDVVASDASGNTAMGQLALFKLDTPSCAISSACYNTAAGAGSLYDNTDGSFNTAFGFQTLNSNGSGINNTAAGYRALFSNTSGTQNTALGSDALYYSNVGEQNVAVGQQSLYFDTEGSANTAIGMGALTNVSSGSGNTAVGEWAGEAVLGSSNVDIANLGTSEDNGTIRIGTVGIQTAAYIAGIESTKVTGNAVYVTASGQLGVKASAERYKSGIASMGPSTAKLAELRPVTFRLKSEPDGEIQYGLVAEEVAKVYPELVIRDAASVIQGVRYDELAPMLLNELQKQQQKIASQDRRQAAQDTKLAKLQQANMALQAALHELLVKNQRLALR